jgi:hypothetical protein
LYGGKATHHDYTSEFERVQSRAGEAAHVSDRGAVTRGAVALLLITVLLAACYAADHDMEPVVIDPIELESFTDGFFSTQMERLHMPGLSLVLVQNGEMMVKG